ncbi:odorant receptor 49b-like [Euwallacea fornicatus]|uniref:odorant receptor 49b-like n=1 Tax=Euwallacea fornicatus TaxID=995702 RepID=UPI00338E5A84
MAGFFCVDWLGLVTVIHIKVFVKTLGHAFHFIDKNDDNIQENQALLKLKIKRITKCVEQLREIYQCADMVDNFLSSQLLIQEFFFTGLICCCIYKATSDISSFYEMSYIFSMVIITVSEVLLVCYNYQTVTFEMSELPNDIYAMEWINYNTQMKKNLIFLIRRVQKPYYFTLGLGFPLDIGVFINIMKTSYSLYTLLNQSAQKISDKT